ncbi:hypothetical protein ABW21_db0201484 [Orbilia brochopaga]|nr:hypothetical protein ABW21_db0201484 [Drechslerella brochopaga]
MSDKATKSQEAKAAAPSDGHHKALQPGTLEWHLKEMDEIARLTGTAPPRIMQDPPEWTPEEKTAWKIKSLRELIADFSPEKFQLPPAHKQSMEMALQGWETGSSTWTEGKAYLWTPTGLKAEGPTKEIRHMACSDSWEGNRDNFLDEVG